MGLPAGKLTHRVRFERRAEGKDAYGQAQVGWTFVAERWAWIVYGGGQERREAAQEGATQAATVRVRRCSTTAGLSPLDRVLFDPGKAAPVPADAPEWNVISVTPIGMDAIELAVVRQPPRQG